VPLNFNMLAGAFLSSFMGSFLSAVPNS